MEQLSGFNISEATDIVHPWSDSDNFNVFTDIFDTRAMSIVKILYHGNTYSPLGSPSWLLGFSPPLSSIARAALNKTITEQRVINGQEEMVYEFHSQTGSLTSELYRTLKAIEDKEVRDRFLAEYLLYMRGFGSFPETIDENWNDSATMLFYLSEDSPYGQDIREHYLMGLPALKTQDYTLLYVLPMVIVQRILTEPNETLAVCLLEAARITYEKDFKNE